MNFITEGSEYEAKKRLLQSKNSREVGRVQKGQNQLQGDQIKELQRELTQQNGNGNKWTDKQQDLTDWMEGQDIIGKIKDYKQQIHYDPLIFFRTGSLAQFLANWLFLHLPGSLVRQLSINHTLQAVELHLNLSCQTANQAPCFHFA